MEPTDAGRADHSNGAGLSSVKFYHLVRLHSAYQFVALCSISCYSRYPDFASAAQNVQTSQNLALLAATALFHRWITPGKDAHYSFSDTRSSSSDCSTN